MRRITVSADRVFDDTHGLVLQWVRQGVLDGLRIDHPDGLRDPEQYFRRIYQAAPNSWLILEKILGADEHLPAAWPVAGTTGYDFLNRVAGLLIDPEGERPLSEFYTEFTGESSDYSAMVHDKKHLVLRDLFASDINRLTSSMVDVCERHPKYRDYTRRDLNSMLREVIACFPVYRTYVRAPEKQISEDDIRYVTEAIETAKAHRPEIDADLFDFFRDLLLVRIAGDVESELVMRFQQHTGPIMAKGVEDTVFYNYNRLVALNEVGGNPGRFGLTLDQFHENCLETQAHWPESMLATTTHDTKRSEDVRARIALLSEIPRPWREAVGRWAAHNERHKQGGMPDRNTEYVLYQTLVGAWPIELDRVAAYMRKGVREAKVNTSWNNPKPEYEEALEAFIRNMLGDLEFVAELAAFVEPLIEPGRINSLSQVLLKLTAPGVPDIYQGNELWDLSLVDPDNRRPVDFDLCRRRLAALKTATPAEILQRMDEGLPKLWVIRQALSLRRNRPELFGRQGGYQPLRAGGARAEHVVAYLRGGKCAVVAPRWTIRLAGHWDDTSVVLPGEGWINELTGEEVGAGAVPMRDLLKRFPVALLSAP